MLLTKKDAAKRLGVSPQTVDRLVRDGELEAIEFYGRRKYTSESVDDCYRRHLIQPKAREIWPGLQYTPGMKLV